MEYIVRALVFQLQDIVRKQTKSKFPDVNNAVTSLQDYVQERTASKSGVEDKLKELEDILSKKSEKKKSCTDHIEKIRQAMRLQKRASTGATKSKEDKRKPSSPPTSERATPMPSQTKENTKLRSELTQPEETTELSGRIDQDEEEYREEMADEVRYFVECINGLKEVFSDDTKIALEKIIPVPNGKIKKKVETGYTSVMDVARDISRLKTENQYLRKTLDGLHKYIIGGEERALNEIKAPKHMKYRSIVEVEANVKEVTQKFHKTKTELSASKQEMANKIKEYEHKLSQLASAKLTHDNPAIPDLSDPDRPTKLAEKYSSLYDNQWTDAFAELTKLNPKASEKVLTEQLLNILTDGFNFCKDARQDQVTKLEQLILDPAQSIKSSQGNYNQVNEIFTKHLRDAAKASSIVASESIFKAFVSNTKMNIKYGNLMNLCGAYIEDCVRLCWRMQVQSPPVCIDLGIKEGQPFLKDTYREYTSSGKEIAFLVWPALFLHEKGPLLMKGVAEAK